MNHYIDWRRRGIRSIWPFLIGLVIVFYSHTSFAYRPVIIGDSEITIRQAPAPLPATERLEQASRLYHSNRLDDAEKLASELIRENAPEAGGAYYLLGKISYARHKKDDALGHFEQLLLRYPNAAPILDGRLTESIVSAIDWEIDDRNWRVAGKFLELLRKLDQERMALILYGLEQQVEQEITEFQAVLASLEPSPQRSITQKLPVQDQASCDFVGRCFRFDKQCEAQTGRKVKAKRRELQASETKRWNEESDRAFQHYRQQLTTRALEALQAFPLLRELASETAVQNSLMPQHFIVPSPFDYQVETGYGEAYKKGWRKYAEGLQPYTKWKVCRYLKHGSTGMPRFPSLHFSPLSKEALLSHLRELLRGPSFTPALRRRL